MICFLVKLFCTVPVLRRPAAVMRHLFCSFLKSEICYQNFGGGHCCTLQVNQKNFYWKFVDFLNFCRRRRFHVDASTFDDTRDSTDDKSMFFSTTSMDVRKRANWVSWPPGKMDEKWKHAKRAVFWTFWEQSGQAGVENGAMLTTYLFRYTSECTIS